MREVAGYAKRWQALVAVLLLAVAGGTWTEAEEPEKLDLGGGATLTFSVEERLRWEYRDDADLNSEADDSGDFMGNRFRLGLKVDAGENFTLFLQGQDNRIWWSDFDAVAIENHFDDLRQAYMEVRNIAGVEGLSAKLGRQELIYGDQRLIGPVGWSNVGRTFDAIKVRFARKSFFVDGIWAGARQRPLMPDRDTQSLSGLYAGFLQNCEDINVEAYALLKSDTAWLWGEIARPADHTRITTYGTRVIWKPVEGLKAVGELAVQDGHKGPDSHSSNAQHLKAEYAFKSGSKPVIGIEYNRAKGDRDPYDGTSGSFDNLFPTNHDKYGLMDYHNWSNIRDLKVYSTCNPYPWLTVGLEGHRFHLDSANAPWTSAGGAVMGWDAAGLSGRDLGKEVDFTASGKLFGKLGWLAGYSWYFPGSYAERVRGGDNSHFGYIQLTVSF